MVNFRKSFEKIFFSETIRGMKLKLDIHAKDISFCIIVFLFWSDKNSGCYDNL